ncbi:MAG: DUF2007 domain-containing protein [Spirochaetia bacterium]|jgi:hypothetical protein|nr:DUF2007 domain-containing protein [Spirochaetia bacterium]
MDTVEIRTFTQQFNAEIAKGLLEEAGISAVLDSDDAGGAYPNIFFTGKGYRLLVRADDRERAEEVLSVLKPENTR